MITRTFKEASRLTRPEFKHSASTVGVIDAMITSPDYKKLYVSVPGGLEVFDQQVLVFDPDYKQTPAKIALPGQDGQHMAIHVPTGKMYYAFGRDNQVAVIDTNTDKVVKTIAVKGGPTDATWFVGGEAWVTAADGSVSIINTSTDEVVKTIQTGGKGPSRLSIAHDLRYIAATHEDSGDVSILQPMTKEVAGTIKIGKGPLSAGFAPAGIGMYPGYRDAGDPRNYKYPPTSQLYIAGQSTVSTVDLEKIAVTGHQTIGQNLTEALIHYTYPNSFGDGTPRDETATRIMANDLFTYYDNAMAQFDVSPLHEHREDMVGIHIGEGVAKVGCWHPECPADAPVSESPYVQKYGYGVATAASGPGNVPLPPGSEGVPLDKRFSEGLALVGNWTGEPHGELHIEEGITPSPRRMAIFMMRNNYYRATNPKMKSDFEGKPGFGLNFNMSRAWVWNYILEPGKPLHLPKTEYALLFLGGGNLLETHDGVPTVVHRLFSEFEYDPTEKTVEAVGNAGNSVRILVIEFK